jgi:hypothetical protein
MYPNNNNNNNADQPFLNHDDMNRGQVQGGGAANVRLDQANIRIEPAAPFFSKTWFVYQLRTINWTNFSLMIVILALSSSIKSQQAELNQAKGMIDELQSRLTEINSSLTPVGGWSGLSAQLQTATELLQSNNVTAFNQTLASITSSLEYAVPNQINAAVQSAMSAFFFPPSPFPPQAALPWIGAFAECNTLQSPPNGYYITWSPVANQALTSCDSVCATEAANAGCPGQSVQCLKATLVLSAGQHYTRTVDCESTSALGPSHVGNICCCSVTSANGCMSLPAVP